MTRAMARERNQERKEKNVHTVMGQVKSARNNRHRLAALLIAAHAHIVAGQGNISKKNVQHAAELVA